MLITAVRRLNVASRHLWVEVLRGLCPPGYRVVRARRKAWEANQVNLRG